VPKILLPTLLLLTLSISTGLQAIVIRHDTGYARHLASESQFPAVFWLEKRDQRKICVATLIDAQWAITAAHCVEETGLKRAMDASESFAVHIANASVLIDEVVIHPSYRFRKIPESIALEVDLALLHLSQPVLSPAPLSLYRSADEFDQVATFLGWGYFGIGTTGMQLDDGRMRQAQNRVVDATGSRLRFDFDDPRDSAALALPLEGLPGLGDSGGPALLRSGNGFELAGVAVGEVSAAVGVGQELGRYGAVAVYERLSAHLDWIEASIATFDDYER
jgi:secreted trypsin-like serine protease